MPRLRAVALPFDLAELFQGVADLAEVVAIDDLGVEAFHLSDQAAPVAVDGDLDLRPARREARRLDDRPPKALPSAGA